MVSPIKTWCCWCARLMDKKEERSSLCFLRRRKNSMNRGTRESRLGVGSCMWFQLPTCFLRSAPLLSYLTMDELPSEIILKIFGYLSLADFSHVLLLSHSLNEIANDPVFWKNLCLFYSWDTLEGSPGMHTDTLGEPLQDQQIAWKAIFQSRYHLNLKDSLKEHF